VSAGHPPILRRDPSGHVEIVGGGRRALLGVGGGSVEPEVLDFSPGTVLLVYTDGLIERPGEIIDEGFERLARLLERTTDVDTLVAEMTPDGPRRDDIALVLLTRDPDGITSASTSVRPDRPR
jgi:serine phosphatase RsbU (regulator of sigma subunit)